MSLTNSMNVRQQKYYDLLLQVARERGFVVLGTYKDSKTRIDMICNNGHTISISPNNFKTGYGCVDCAGLSPIKSENDFIEMAERHNYSIIGKYVNNLTLVDAICDEGHQIKICPGDFKRGHRSPKSTKVIRCSNQIHLVEIKRTSLGAKETFIKLAEERGYVVAGSYTNNRTLIPMICDNDHDVMIAPDNFKAGRGCVKCSKLCPIESERIFIEELERQKFILVGKYVSNNTLVDVICKEDHSIQVRPCHIKRGIGCPKCAHNCPIEAERTFGEEAIRRGYAIKSKYLGTHAPVNMTCDQGHHIMVMPSNFKRGQGCGVCNQSKGERLVSLTLTYLNVEFKPQYSFPSSDRSYDFGFNSYKGGVVIEWDGIQHFSYLPYFHDQNRSFEQERLNDISKTRDVIIRGNKLIRIDYTWIDKSVEELSDFISKAIDSADLLIVSTPKIYSWLQYEK
jgi:hypothetical protein